VEGGGEEKTVVNGLDEGGKRSHNERKKKIFATEGERLHNKGGDKQMEEVSTKETIRKGDRQQGMLPTQKSHLPKIVRGGLGGGESKEKVVQFFLAPRFENQGKGREGYLRKIRGGKNSRGRSEDWTLHRPSQKSKSNI